MGRLLVTVALLLAWATACQPQPPADPEAAYRSFYQALQDKDWDTAVACLAPEVVDRLRQTGRRMARLLGRADIEPLELMLLNASAEMVQPLRSVEVIKRGEATAVLEVTAGPCREDQKCAVSEVTARRQDGSWVLAPRMPPLLRGASRAEPEPGKEAP